MIGGAIAPDPYDVAGGIDPRTSREPGAGKIDRGEFTAFVHKSVNAITTIGVLSNDHPRVVDVDCFSQLRTREIDGCEDASRVQKPVFVPSRVGIAAYHLSRTVDAPDSAEYGIRNIQDLINAAFEREREPRS